MSAPYTHPRLPPSSQSPPSPPASSHTASSPPFSTATHADADSSSSSVFSHMHSRGAWCGVGEHGWSVTEGVGWMESMKDGMRVMEEGKEEVYPSMYVPYQ